ncbi:MAG: hypothetical protein WAM17_19335 [Rhodoplanes sp.]
MAEIVNARPPGPPGSNVRKLQDPAERTVDRRIGERGSLYRQKQVVVRSGKAAAHVEIALESLHDALVQRLLPVLSSYLGHSDLEGTKVYLSMTPELLRQASLRFARYVGGGENA